MTDGSELGAYLRSRRARLQPLDVGLPDGIRTRRVPGLRREEVALLAGVSVDYYVQLEQGRVGAVSVSVLDAVARALRLDEGERKHLFHLAQPRTPGPRRRAPLRVRPAMHALLATFEVTPAYVVGPRTEVLAWNPLACAVFTDFERLPQEQRSMARLVYLDESWRSLYHGWDEKADDVVSFLRFQAGRHADDPQLAALVGELSMKSPEFAARWSRHAVRDKSHGSVRLNNPLVGQLDLTWEALRPPVDDDLTLIAYAAATSESRAALRLLASYAATNAAATSAVDDADPSVSDPGHAGDPALRRADARRS